MSRFLSAMAASTLLAACASASATVVFEDTFTSAANWTKFTGNNPVLATSFQPSTGSGSGWTAGTPNTLQPAAVAATALQLNNSAVEYSLSQPVTADWKLTVRLLSTSYGRTQQVGFTDAAGNGYSFALNGGNPQQYGLPIPGMGQVTIREVTGWAGGSATYSNTGTVLGSGVNGTHWLTGYAVVQPATNPLVYDTSVPWAGYAEFELSWDASSGDLAIRENGSLLATRNDTTVTSFSRIVLGGNTNGSFDYVSLDVVPEPTMLAPLALGATCLLRRRKPAKA